MKPRLVLLLLAASLVGAGVVPFASASSRTTAPLVFKISPTAAVGKDGLGIDLSGTARCVTKRYFAVFVQSVESTSGALGWGGYPAAGAIPSAYSCGTTARHWSTLVAHPASQTAKPFGTGRVRVCALARTWGPHLPTTLQPFCATVRVLG